MARSENAAAHQEKEVRFAELTPLMDEILSAGGTVELTVTGGSMRPMLLHKKSRVRLIRRETVQRGDIPLYRRKNGGYVLHRIVGEENGAYLCCGDAQWHIERGICADQIIGVVTDFSREGKWASCENANYRLYWRFWLWIRPLRRLIFGGLRRVRRKLRRLGGKR